MGISNIKISYFREKYILDFENISGVPPINNQRIYEITPTLKEEL